MRSSVKFSVSFEGMPQLPDSIDSAIRSPEQIGKQDMGAILCPIHCAVPMASVCRHIENARMNGVLEHAHIVAYPFGYSVVVCKQCRERYGRANEEPVCSGSLGNDGPYAACEECLDNWLTATDQSDVWDMKETVSTKGDSQAPG